MMNEQDLKEKLHSTLISKAKISDICENLQDKYTEQSNQYNYAVYLLGELLDANKKLQFVIETERKSFARFKETTISLSPEEINQMEEAIESTKRIIAECRLGDNI